MKTDKTVFGNIPKEYNLIKDGDTLPFADGIIKCIDGDIVLFTPVAIRESAAAAFLNQ